MNARSVEFISSGCVKQPGKDVFNYIYRETGESNHYGNYEALIVGVFNYNEQGNRIYDKKGIADRFDVDDFLTSHPEYQRLEKAALLTHKTQELIDEKLVEAKTLDVQSNWDNLSSILFAGDQSA